MRRWLLGPAPARAWDDLPLKGLKLICPLSPVRCRCWLVLEARQMAPWRRDRDGRQPRTPRCTRTKDGQDQCTVSRDASARRSSGSSNRCGYLFIPWIVTGAAAGGSPCHGLSARCHRSLAGFDPPAIVRLPVPAHRDGQPARRPHHRGSGDRGPQDRRRSAAPPADAMAIGRCSRRAASEAADGRPAGHA
jgi:hypothetical protein